MLKFLGRADVTEVALATGRAAVVKTQGAYRPVSQETLTTPDIVRILGEAGPGNAASLGEQPLQWSVKHAELGALQIVAVKRGGMVQAKIARIPGAGAAASAPSAPQAKATGAPAAAAPATPAAAPSTGPLPTGSLEEMLRAARAAQASDLHLTAARPPQFRLAGDLLPQGEALSAAHVERLLVPHVPERLRAQLEQEGSCDFSLELRGAGRFRANVARTRTGLKGCFRIIALELPTLKSLGLPDSLAGATHHHQGLVVLTGPSGHGKTTTMAALVDLINSETHHHLISVEDPVEFVHPRKQATLSQREVGTHTKSFQSALKASLREDPDVIVVGELRDTETVRMALSASETGHLVIATMNTPSAAKTIDRLIDLFPQGDQPQVRMSLAVGLRMVVSQRLVPSADRKRMHVAAELLPGSVSLGNLIRDEKTYQIPSLQQRGKSMGIVRLEDSLADLVRAGKTTLDIASIYAESPEELAALVKQPTAPPPAADPRKKGA